MHIDNILLTSMIIAGIAIVISIISLMQSINLYREAGRKRIEKK